MPPPSTTMASTTGNAVSACCGQVCSRVLARRDDGTGSDQISSHPSAKTHNVKPSRGLRLRMSKPSGTSSKHSGKG